MYIIRSPNFCYVKSINRTGIYTVTSEHLGGGGGTEKWKALNELFKT
jgi:hypothetical protein